MALRKNPKYDIKKSYRRTFEIGIILSLLLVISAFKFIPKYEKVKLQNTNPPDIIIVLDDIEITRHEAKIPPKPLPPEIKISDDDFVDVELKQTEIDLNENMEAPKDAPPKDNNIIEESNEKYTFLPLENQPEPIGGIESILQKITYPEIAKRTGIEGKVIIFASVNEKGEVVNAEVAKGIGGGCDEEAVKAVMEAKISPGLQRGVPVKVKVSIPIVFKLK